MSLVIERFGKLSKELLQNTTLFGPKQPTKVRDFTTDDEFVKNLKQEIAAAESKFQSSRRNGYVAPLKNNLRAIIGKLNEFDQATNKTNVIRYVFLTLMINAVLQPAEPKLGKSVDILQSMVNDFYQRFLGVRRRLKINTPLCHKGPPLIGFIGPLPPRVSQLPPLPCTLEVAFLREFLGKKLASEFTLGACGLPPGYRNYPLLWGILGHEIGGHYVLSADDRLIQELQNKIYRELSKHYSKSSMNALPSLWRFWTEEAAADVCGILHMGPSSGIGAISFYTAVLPLAWRIRSRKLAATYRDQDWHPISVLIPDLLCGAIARLDNLSESRRMRYIAQLKEIGSGYSDRMSDIEFGEKAIVRDPRDFANESKFTNLPRTLPLRDLQESARMVGAYITSVKLDALGGNSLKDLATWTNDHEDAALMIAEELLANKQIDEIHVNGKIPRPLQILAGGVLAVVRQPSLFTNVNDRLLASFYGP